MPLPESSPLPFPGSPVHQAAAVLRTALAGHRLEGFPVPYADRDRIYLGEVPVPTADRLATLLGAEPAPIRADLPDWPEGRRIVQRVRDAVRAAVAGEFVDIDFWPYCPRCDEDPVVTLGSLSPVAARDLGRVLRTRTGSAATVHDV
ncbi:hypothetical protein ABZ929_01000 [Streptomyces physcomitrii]|uniref:hypothetical protein n=1 Tax=Streptomyces physcomitrii TaxID=2724184 RepID=UPI0033D99DE8